MTLGKRLLIPSLAATLALLALTTPASADYRKVIRDCATDGRLDHAYTWTDLVRALDQLPPDIREYTDCATVIRAALSKQRRRTSGGRWHGANYNCHPRHARTIKDNGTVRVYSHAIRYLGFVNGRRVYACSYATGRTRFLGTHDPGLDDGQAVSPVRLRGALVGWEHRSWSHYGYASYRLVVWDSRTNFVLRDIRQWGDGNDLDPSWSSEGFVMDRAGSVAWIAVADTGASVTFVVLKSDRTRGRQMLDAASDIDPRSLRRRGRVISWRHGHETRTKRFVR